MKHTEEGCKKVDIFCPRTFRAEPVATQEQVLGPCFQRKRSQPCSRAAENTMSSRQHQRCSAGSLHGVVPQQDAQAQIQETKLLATDHGVAAPRLQCPRLRRSTACLRQWALLVVHQRDQQQGQHRQRPHEHQRQATDHRLGGMQGRQHQPEHQHRKGCDAPATRNHIFRAGSEVLQAFVWEEHGQHVRSRGNGARQGLKDCGTVLREADRIPA